jgi:peptidyl-prolyl cis-trans isomerase C
MVFRPILRCFSFGAVALALAGCGANERVLARVGSEKITWEDLEREMTKRPLAQEEYLATVPGRKELLELLVRRKIMLAESQRAAVDQREDVRGKLVEIDREFARQRHEARERLLVGELFRSLQDHDLKVTDEEIRQYWSREKEVKASHILVSRETEARQALEKLGKGEKFETLAKASSEDPVTARRGGDLGFFMRGTLVPEFEDAVFALKVGETSGVVPSAYGYHVIRKTDERPLSRRPYEDVRDAIRSVLANQKFQAWLEKTRGRYTVATDTSALENITAPSGAQPPRSS